MTIEIADRLIKLRKKHGLSQEELADKLGLSRQAVSKWERAEASPDTDNLICLAKLYGVSLDELLSTDDDVETIVKEQVKPEAKEEKGDSIVLTDDDGSKVIIKDNHIRCVDKDGKEVEKFQDKFSKVVALVDCCLTSLMIVLYILLAIFSKTFTWANGWVFFFVPDFICSIIRAIHSKNPNKVNVAFFALFTFFFVCLVVPGLEANLWHPMWVVFLLIPVYHSIFGTVNKIRGKEEDEDKDED